MLNVVRRNKVLGVAIGERSALLAEVRAAPRGNGGRPRVVRAGEFVYPAGVGLADAAALGTALREFLEEQRFAARGAVVGVPAKWVLCRGKEVPPADPRAVAELLLLQAESEFGATFNDLAYDYAGEASAAEGRSVMLMALPSRHLRQVADLAAAAGLRLLGVTPVAAALGAATSRGSSAHSQSLLLGPGGAEFISHNRTCPRAVRYLGAPGAPAEALADELLRASAGMPATDAGGALTVWDDAGAADGVAATPICAALDRALGTACRVGDVRDLGVSADGLPPDQRRAAAPVTLALGALGASRPPVDFLHPRLAPPKEHRAGRRVLLAVAAGVALLAGAGFAWSDLHQRQLDLDRMTATLARRQPAVKSAQAFVDKVRFARGWQGGGPPRFLACLRDVTTAVPEDGQTFLTSLNLHDDLKGALSGKSASDAAALALLDRLKAAGRFADAKMSFDNRTVGGRSGGQREVSFTVTFDYVPAAAADKKPVPAVRAAPTRTGP